MTTSRVVETSVTVNNRTKLTRAIVGHQFMKTQNERKRLRAHQEPCAHLTQVQAEKNMWDFNVIYVAAIHLRRAFMSVNVRKINSRFNFCYAAQPHAAATPCSNTEGRFATTILSQHSVAMLEQCWNYSKQCRTNAATLCSAKNRRCESSRVTLPLNLFRDKCYCILTSIFRCMRLSEGFKVLMDNFCNYFLFAE